ncbi:hypothetical protein IW150_006797 [Coemansia sp. RSA 2607]|nr:hypothetical protein IW150_006797 [Coemansia sp. RSA 2607]
MHPSSRYSTDAELDAQLISKTNGRMAPFEYDRIIEITKKVEKNLGIPGVSLDEINTDSEVNQSLVVNAMYSKLYNDAFNSLCQRMLACLLSQRKFGSVDEVASFLQHNPAAHNASAEHLRNEKLTMLEYKLLCYVFENVSQSNYPIPEPHCSGDDSAANPSDQTVSKSLHTSNRRGLRKEPCRSSPNLRDYGRRPVVKTAKQRIKSKIAHAYQHLPMSREQTHQSVHNFMESAIAHDSVGTSQPNKPSKLRFHLHNQPSINKKDIGPPIPMRRSVSTGIVNPPTRTPHSDSSLHNTSDEETHTKSEETQDSPGIKINIQPSSD